MASLAPVLQAFRSTLPTARVAGITATGVPGVHFFWDERPIPRSPLLYSSGLVIIGQGRKIGYLGGRRFQYDADACLVLGVPVPFECEVHATPEEPLLGIRIDIDLAVLHHLVARLQERLDFSARPQGLSHPGVEPVPMDDALIHATSRLITCLHDPMDRLILGAAAFEEVVYRILRSPQGQVLYDLTQHHTQYASIARALARLHGDYQQPHSVEELARESGMSASSFHRAFKGVTGESPLQYLKKLRLLKAKEALVFQGLRVEEAAYEVGYVSPSQFSREFKRYFSVPPSEASTLPYSGAA